MNRKKLYLSLQASWVKQEYTSNYKFDGREKIGAGNQQGRSPTKGRKKKRPPRRRRHKLRLI